MYTKPEKQHEWLKQLLGEWTISNAIPGEGPDCMSMGTESVKSLGDLWIIAEGTGPMPDGGTAYNRMTLGFDPAQGAFVGSWVGSMMTHQWIYRGQLDPEEKILTLESEGPDMEDQTKMGLYRDIIEIKDANTRLLSSEYRTEGGDWKRFMSLSYTRKT
jgi:hypothetical protein